MLRFLSEQMPLKMLPQTTRVFLAGWTRSSLLWLSVSTASSQASVTGGVHRRLSRLGPVSARDCTSRSGLSWWSQLTAPTYRKPVRGSATTLLIRVSERNSGVLPSVEPRHVVVRATKCHVPHHHHSIMSGRKSRDQRRKVSKKKRKRWWEMFLSEANTTEMTFKGLVSGEMSKKNACARTALNVKIRIQLAKWGLFGEGRKFWPVLRTLTDYLRVKRVLRLELELGLCWAQRVTMIRAWVRPINVLTKIGQCASGVCEERQSAAISVVTCWVSPFVSLDGRV